MALQVEAEWSLGVGVKTNFGCSYRACKAVIGVIEVGKVVIVTRIPSVNIVQVFEPEMSQFYSVAVIVI